MDKITIQGLQIQSLIGVYDWEREAKQALRLDLVLELDLHRAATTDNVEDTVDYAKVAEALTDIADNSQFQLLEALAGAMVDFLLNTYPALRASIKLTKPDILPNAQSVAVEITREA